jgi:hypothetical protein
MDDISALGVLSRRLASRAAPVALQPELFDGVFLPGYRCWRSFFLSVGLHFVLVAISIPLSQYMPESEQQAWKRYARAYRSLEIRLPEHMYIASASPAEKKKHEQVLKREMKPEAPKPLPREGAKEAAKLQTPRAPARRFELPPAPKKPEMQQTLLQAHLPLDLALTQQVRLPQMMFWGAHTTRLPKPIPKRFVEPGRKAPTVLSVNLDAPPQLDIPSQVTSNLRINPNLQALGQGMLHLPRPTTPIRVFQPPQPGSLKHGSSFDTLAGEPVNIVALNANPALPSDHVVIPAGQQIGALPPMPANSEAASGPARISMGGAGTGMAGEGLGRGRGDGGSGGTGPGGTGSGAGGTGAGRSGSGAGASPGGSGAGVATAGSFGPAINYTAPIRIEHPSNGVYDIVVVQSSSQGAFPESAGALTGRPVFTVYLQVGAPKSWIMQYCVPREVDAGPRIAGGAVYIGNATPLKAPFPLLTVLPPVTMLPRTSYIMVHGFLDKSGLFKDLTVLRAPDGGIAELLLPQLAQWVFRPATRDGVPVIVEVLLAIPPQEV